MSASSRGVTTRDPASAGNPSVAYAAPMRERRRSAAAARSCSCSTWRLSCCSERAQVPAHGRRGDLLGEPAEDARRRRRRRRGAARRACGRRARSRSRQRPRWSMPVTEVQARSRGARELDDLDQPADLGRADPHAASGSARRGRRACSPTTSQRVTPAMKCRYARGVGDLTPTPASGGAATSIVLGDPHPITGKRRSAASASRVSCISRMTWS